MTDNQVVMATMAPSSVVPSMGDEAPSAAETFVYISEAIIIPIILIIGVISNCFSLLILPRATIAPSFKTCLLALTMSDLAAGVAGFVQMMVEVIAFRGRIQWGIWDDRAVTSFALYFVFSWFIGTSAAIVIAIVAIRHYTISRPVSARLNITARCARVVCVCLLLGTLVVFLPTSLNVLWQSCHREQRVELCLRLRRAVPNLKGITSTYLMVVTLLYGPVLVVVYVACMIGIRANLRRTEAILDSLQEEQSLEVRRAKGGGGGGGSSGSVGGGDGMGSYGKAASTPPGKADMKSRGSTSTGSNGRRRSIMKITKTLLLILLLDTICSLPLVVQAFAMVIAPRKTVFSTTNTAYHVFDAVAEIFLVSRQAYNFWLYAFSHRNFRARAKALLFCLCSSRHRRLWQSPNSGCYDRGRPTRLSSVNSTKLRGGMDGDTDATWVQTPELKTAERRLTAVNGQRKEKAGKAPDTEKSRLLNAGDHKEQIEESRL